MGDIDEELLEDLYSWVDGIPLSRPKKDIRRDFSDGVLVAEIIKSFIPNVVDIHNYPAALATDKKLINWSLLNRKVFKKLGFDIADDVMKNIANCKPWAIEQFLMMLRRKIDRYLYEERRDKDRIQDHRPEADRGFHRKDPPKGKAGRRDISPQGKGSKEAVQQAQSINRLYAGHGPAVYRPAQHNYADAESVNNPRYHGTSKETVPKLVVEEKEQEILAKEETISILEAKVRRLEHLLHLKDIRIDDLQNQVEELKSKRPTAHYKK